MKNLLSFWCLLCFSLCLQAQQITAIEYYFNSDPGIGKGIPLAADTDIETAVDISGLVNGIHTLYVRAKDSKNQWSLLQSRTFIKVGNNASNAPLKAIEYYFNDDPGIGKATAIEAATEIETAIDVSDLTDGVHQLYIRAQDNNDNWSLLQHRTFIKGVADVLPEITYIEYYIDDDPGLGQGESMNFTSDEFTFTEVSSNYVIDLSALKDGVHNIYVRAKDDNEHWSMLQHRTFIKLPLAEPTKITEIEVKVEGIEPYNEWTPLTNFSPDAEVCADFAIIEMCDLPDGDYSIQARAIDDDQRTGPIFDELLEIDCRNPQIELDDGEIKDEEPLIVTGSGFKSNCALDISVVRFPNNDKNTYQATTNEEGSFEFSLVMPFNLEAGLYVIEVMCANQENNPRAKVFVYEKTSNVSLINIISPSIGDELKWENICITWNDIIRGKKQYSDVLQFEKQVEYDIFYAAENQNDWIFLKTYTDQVFPNKYPVNFKTCVDIPLEGNILIKIENKKDKDLFDVSDPFIVSGLSQSIYEVDFLWDKSFPVNYINNPLGVASDGVARIILQLNDYSGFGNIQNVEVSLSDPLGGATHIDMLGKVMAAKADIIDYSNEANDATETTAFCNNGNCGNENQFNFWYVAPEGFSESENYHYDQARERIVKATFTLTFEDNDTEPVIVQRNIKVVRPPLLLVHGLGGNPSTWDNFSSKRKDETVVKFIDDERFTYKNAINLFRYSAFKQNAKVLLGTIANSEYDNEVLFSSTENSLIGNISIMRSMGYASNQVNYVGHSMGGVVIRVAAEDDYAHLFYSNEITDKYPYSSYGNGLVNRLITINSPHNGSIATDLIAQIADWADELLEYNKIEESCIGRFGQDVYKIILNSMYLSIEKINSSMCEYSAQTFEATDNLRVRNGYTFQDTKLKSHFIAGDLFFSEAVYDTFDVLNKPMESINDIIKLLILLIPNNYIDKITNPNLVKLIKILKKTKNTINFIKHAATFIDIEDYALDDSDFLVTVDSQLAGGKISDLYTSISYGVSHSTTFEFAGFTPAPKSLENGNSVFDLLNYSDKGKFTNIIPTNQPNLTNGGGLLVQALSEVFEKMNQDELLKIKSNPEGIKIIQPNNNDVVFVDSLLNIQVFLKDTIGLVYADITFQDEFLSFTNINDTLINQTMVISDQYLGKQDLTVTGIYNYGDSTSLAIETITLEVKAKDAPVDLIIEPAINYGYTGEHISPDYFAVFPTFVSELKSTNTDISVEIENEDILTFNKSNNTFTGKAEGETFAIFKYFDTADTAQFIIYQSYDEEPIDTMDTIDDVAEVMSVEPIINIYPNPAENEMNIDYSLTKAGKVSIEIRDIAGRLMAASNLGLKKPYMMHTQHLSLTKIPSGMYLVNLYVDNYKHVSSKFVVNR